MTCRRVGILVFDQVEVRDFCGPFEVFSVTRLVEDRSREEPSPYEVDLVATGGLKVVPDHTPEDPTRTNLAIPWLQDETLSPQTAQRHHRARREQGRVRYGEVTLMARLKKSSPRLHRPTDQGDVRLYTLEVFLLSGPIAEKFARKNPVISRTIQIRGDQTLEDLHHAIFDAFGRWEAHMYEFQFGKGPMDPEAPRYVLPGAFETETGEGNPPAGRVDQTRIDSLGLEVGRRFGYWFDFGDDWWHQINVEAIEVKAPSGKFPKVTKRVGQSPPQYAEEDE